MRRLLFVLSKLGLCFPPQVLPTPNASLLFSLGSRFHIFLLRLRSPATTRYFPPNASFGAVLLAKPLNTTAAKVGPWVAHTTYSYEAIEGLFRHNAREAAVALATGHVRDMQRTFGWTIFPEAWSLAATDEAPPSAPDQPERSGESGVALDRAFGA